MCQFFKLIYHNVHVRRDALMVWSSRTVFLLPSHSSPLRCETFMKTLFYLQISICLCVRAVIFYTCVRETWMKKPPAMRSLGAGRFPHFVFQVFHMFLLFVEDLSEVWGHQLCQTNAKTSLNMTRVGKIKCFSWTWESSWCFLIRSMMWDILEFLANIIFGNIGQIYLCRIHHIQ